MQSSPWALEASLLACGSLPTTVRLLGVADLHLFRSMYGAEVWDTTKAVKHKMSKVAKKARSILVSTSP
jgi:hypothetical protein